jgi:hypothetical protein
LELEAKIHSGDVRGRIDHLAVDLKRQRLYVAELGNDTVGVVDLGNRKALRTLADLREPQGIGYVPSTDTLYVANAGDGSVRLFRGEDLTPAGQISLGTDADNVRVDDVAHRVYVGHGDGALAVIDAESERKIADYSRLDGCSGDRRSRFHLAAYAQWNARVRRFSRPQLATGDSVFASRARSQRPSVCLRYMVIRCPASFVVSPPARGVTDNESLHSV